MLQIATSGLLVWKDSLLNQSTRLTIPNLDPALRPVPQGNSLTIPTPPATRTFDDGEDDNNEQGDSDRNNDSDFAPTLTSVTHFSVQEELHDLMRDLNSQNPCQSY